MSQAVHAVARSLRDLLDGRKYSIDYYQRDYRWQEEHVYQLLDDLTGAFLNEYRPTHSRSEVQAYATYFMGPVILSEKNGTRFLVDGQQRLSTLTLLLIYLRNLVEDEKAVGAPDVSTLISSTRFGQQSFNLEVDERLTLMRCLYNGAKFPGPHENESVENLRCRYQDIEDHFPQLCKGAALPYFLDWLLERTQFIEISAYSDDVAYTIFETMNDRGLSLTQSEMLKGFILSRIGVEATRTECSRVWKREMQSISTIDKDAEQDFFRTWFRSRYALKTRSGSNSVEQDYDRMGPEFHRWFKDTLVPQQDMKSEDFERFVLVDLPYYSKWYRKARSAAKAFDTDLPSVYYNATREPSLKQEMLLLSPLDPSDDDETTLFKMRLMSRFLDIFIARRVWAVRNLTLPALRNTFLALSRQTRNLDVESLAARLYVELVKPGAGNFEEAPPILTNQNKKRIKALLARLTDYVDKHGVPGHPLDYASIMDARGRSAFEIEHVWADHWERHSDEFSDPGEFAAYRNRLGDLVLLPKSTNASLSDLQWDEKIPKYGTTGQNLLAASLARETYREKTSGELLPDTRPPFRSWLRDTQLAFQPYCAPDKPFDRDAIDQRTNLYRSLAQRIWHPDSLFEQVTVNADVVRRIAREVMEALEGNTRNAGETNLVLMRVLEHYENLDEEDIATDAARGGSPSAKGITWEEATLRVMEDGGHPMTPAEIVEKIEQSGIREVSGRTPVATVESLLVEGTTDPNGRFMRTAPRTYYLR